MRVSFDVDGVLDTPKGFEAAKRAINRGDDFLGSGSTMVAAHQLKRKCFGIELDPKYCQVIVDRMLKLDPTLQIKRNGQAYTKTDELQTYGVPA